MKKLFCLLIIMLLSVVLFDFEATAYRWNFENVNGSYVYQSGFDLGTVTVAVIDSGVNLSHEDIDTDVFVAPYNFIEDNDDVSDDLGHGTNVIGILTSVVDNGIGIDGLSCGVRIMPLKVNSSSVNANVARVVKAIEYAVENKADVINLSMGLTKDVDSFRNAIEKAVNAGIIVVAAVGNDASDTLAYPAAYDTVVGVGSVDSSGSYSSYSRYNRSVFITAPGEGVITASIPDNDSYARINGTSIAAPHVTALAAAAKAYKKSIDAYGFMQLLKESADDKGDLGYDFYYGYGILNFKTFINKMTEFDIDLDGLIDTTDIQLLKKCILGTFVPENERTFNACDADGDNDITVTDYIIFKRKILKLI